MKNNLSTGIVKIGITILLVLSMISLSYAQFQMEWGKQQLQNETWTQINLSTYFINPIVVAAPEYTTTTDVYGIDVQITNITNTSFMIRSSDENFASQDNITAHFLILEEGSWTLPGSGIKIEAGSFSTNKVASRSLGWDCPTYGESITFTTAFNNNPLVIATKTSNNNPTTWSTTFKHGPSANADSVSTTQMCIGHSFSKAISPGPFTNNEDLHWIAIDEGNGTLASSEYEILWQERDSGDSGGNWINGYNDPRPFTQSWSHTWSGAPNIIIGAITSVGGSDGGWAVIYDTGDVNDIRIFVDEPNERAHSGSESGGGFAFNNASYIEALPSINWSLKPFDIGFGVITDGNITSSTTIDAYKDHTNITISCISGNCSRITTNYTSINLNHGNSASIDFTCSNQTTGVFNAFYELSSNEDSNTDTLNVSCQIFKEFGDINVTLQAPNPGSTRFVAQNRTLTVEVDITCTGDLNTTCGNVTAYPRYNGSLLNLGDGSDGALSVSTINTVINNYTYLTGNELAGSTSLNVNDNSAFSTGDSILVIQMQNGTGIGEAGQYEYATVASTSGSNINLETPLSNSYGSGTYNSVTSSVTQIVRIPQYSDVTINSGASIIAPAWNGFTGGIVIFRSQGSTVINGVINVSETGYRGGTCGTCGNNDWGTQGEGYLGIGSNSLSANGNGGGGGYGPSGYGGEGGGGGGHSTSGGTSTSSFPALGGSSIGNKNLTKLFFGGGGGAGGDNDNVVPPPENIDGGGIIIIFSKEIQNATIEANGETGIYPGGAGGVAGSGAGGSIQLFAKTMNITSLTALGGPSVNGNGGDVGGVGSNGRISLTYETLNLISSTPSSEFNDTIQSGQIIISDSPGNLPLWSLDPQYQTCFNMEQGDSCTLTWEINASGHINSSHLIDIVIESNIPVVNSDTSENFTLEITGNVVPNIIQINPSNGEKVITSNNNISIIYQIEDDDTNLSCNFYVNNILNSTGICNTYTNITQTISVTSGLYNWSISVIDSLNNSVNSSVYEFYIIRNSSKFISKKINWISTNLYFNKINFTDTMIFNEDSKVFTTIDSTLTGGSYSPLYDGSLTFVSFELIYWNTTLSNQYNYSTASGGNYYIGEEFRIGLE